MSNTSSRATKRADTAKASKPQEDAAARQRARDRAGDEAPPRGAGRGKPSGKG